MSVVYAFYLFKGSIRKSDSILSNDLVIVKAERIWMVAAMAKFRKLFQHLPGGTVENYMKPLITIVNSCQILIGHFPQYNPKLT
jgi:hypothetical protein